MSRLISFLIQAVFGLGCVSSCFKKQQDPHSKKQQTNKQTNNGIPGLDNDHRSTH
jgi:tetrahydromethanopterin S-methyltransferase subunit D